MSKPNENEDKDKITLYSILNFPFPCVDPRSWFEYPNISFNATSARAVNLSTRTFLSTMVLLRVFNPPITLPVRIE